MALANISPVSPFDVNNFTAGARTTSGYARTLSPSLDVAYGESMRGIYVGVTGNVSYVKWDGTTQILVGLLGGFWHPIPSLMINSSGTTATSIVVGS